ncbi:RNA 2',3'-cyclic phosphodiesterase [Brevibacillus laterosporus]|uniref:RNA 2',3'-cyclic phosphodiesterase n=1 Tax=Brevibacillus laterosporus TaxID=1465 RepID=UPI00038129B8|nr:RNA 2',3'-cyclic phosphodiesterase [Brevibacillus laterosporus]ATO48448.1 2'-5' RNA ligase [Brevibacillus laterosporus DSM 25]AYB41395.1 RNA 2',3'-cyclic phosphodiesterase [Brevibacillus laterosporus]MBG9771763.1 2'-5' RNA ligase [Brevibacillus laterosporus]MBG9797816.1 2'-5' RNA ligase [Brevibacillus laterosporus]MBG9802320.1 2'-5' RNA ligase [Brevibacillus laterosporus]
MVKRLFIALHVPTDVIAYIEAAQLQVKQELSADRWQPLHNLHLTLHFLGDVDEQKIPELTKDIQIVSSIIRPFSLSIDHFGSFPQVGKPRVLWLGLQGNIESLQQMHLLLGKRLDRHQNIQYDKRSYEPHVTIARKPKLHEERSLPLADWSHRFLPHPKPSWRVEGITLFQSELRPEGAIHTPLFTSLLGETTNL